MPASRRSGWLDPLDELGNLLPPVVFVVLFFVGVFVLLVMVLGWTAAQVPNL